jgi:hypothetical protein
MILVKGGIQMTEKQDYELVDDRDVHETDIPEVPLPEYDAAQFELPDDYEYVEDEGEDNGS